ncbi:MAG: ABC transporter substrate-binding protein [Acidobacteria bacterium]|nr:ABC transporter substrate-binding protein [Acidobacteriota bacterium]
MVRRLAALLVVASVGAWPPIRIASATQPPRVISLIPAVTEMLFAIGAGADVVGVSTFDRFPVEATTRPKVGALLNPDVERILSLQPTLVVVYDTQTELRTRLDRAGIRTLPYHHGSIADIYDTIRSLGTAVGRAAEAEALVRRMQTEIADITAGVPGQRRVPTLFVVSRDPGALRHVYVAGGQGFLNELVEIAGGENVFGDIARPAAEVSIETILTRRPEAIVELWPNRSLDQTTRASEIALWNALPVLPAVRSHRVFEITDDRLAIPGPRLPDGIRALASALHQETTRAGAGTSDRGSPRTVAAGMCAWPPSTPHRRTSTRRRSSQTVRRTQRSVSLG